MDLKLYHIAFVCCLACLAPANAAMAQDGSDAGYSSASEREKTYVYSPGGEGESSGGGATPSSSRTQAVAVKDSSSSRMAVKALQNEPAKSVTKQRTGEDDVLSFNFLYYIIRKYKLQDIVD